MIVQPLRCLVVCVAVLQKDAVGGQGLSRGPLVSQQWCGTPLSFALFWLQSRTTTLLRFGSNEFTAYTPR